MNPVSNEARPSLAHGDIKDSLDLPALVHSLHREFGSPKPMEKRGPGSTEAPFFLHRNV